MTPGQVIDLALQDAAEMHVRLVSVLFDSTFPGAIVLRFGNASGDDDRRVERAFDITEVQRSPSPAHFIATEVQMAASILRSR